MSTSVNPALHTKVSRQVWLRRPEKLWVRGLLLQIHLWVGMLTGLYVLVMALSGSIIVFRNQLERAGPVRSLEWLVDLHENLLLGMTGRAANGVGAMFVTLLCLTGAIIWWPGIVHWRRSLTVNWRSSFARVNWDLHNTLGFWCFLFVILWGISGIYFAFPQPFNRIVDLFQTSGASGKLQIGDMALFWLSNLHFGRLDWFTEALWTVVGAVPAILVFTGMSMYCHSLFVRRATSSRGVTLRND